MHNEILDYSDDKPLRRLPYDLSSLRSAGLPRGFFLEGSNRSQAESVILRLNDIFRTAHSQDNAFPLTRLYTDDIRYEGREGLPDELTTYLLPMPKHRRLNSDSWVLRIHFCLIPDEKNKITGDIYYCSDGEIDRINVYYDHGGEHWFLQCVNDGKHFLLHKMEMTLRRKKRLYPMLVIGMRPAILICLTLVFLLGSGLFAWVAISGREHRENSHPVVAIANDPQTITPLPSESHPLPETTSPPPESTASLPESEQAVPTSTEIAVVSLTSPIKRGKNARLTVSVPPDSLCTIAVFYSSGKSQAAGLEDKLSDSSGQVEWSWKVSSRTKPGDYHIEIGCGNERISLPFTVTE